MNSASVFRRPLVVIVGSTATGKTRLSLALSKRFNGQILNTDSVQVYNGLDIATCKPSISERSVCKHHMFDLIDFNDSTFSVKKYRDMCLKILIKVLSVDEDKCLPILVGGTNYYIEAILWKNLIEQDESVAEVNQASAHPCDDSNRSAISFHKELFAKDPEAAKKIHPSDKRRTVRALQVIDQYGRKFSDILNDQHLRSGSSFRGEKRFQRVCIIWLDCENDVCAERIKKRTENMLERGLVKELESFWAKLLSQTNDGEALMQLLSSSHGLMKCIGFKEFIPYLKSKEKEKEVLMSKCAQQVTLATIRYAKQQKKWIRNRLLRDDGECFDVYRVDCTRSCLIDDNNEFEEIVFEPCCKIIESFLLGMKSPIDPEPKWTLDASTDKRFAFADFECAQCNNKHFYNELQWMEHLDSRVHKRKVQRLRAIRQIAWQQASNQSRLRSRALTNEVKESFLCVSKE